MKNKVKTMARRYDGQILNCEYGYHWPLTLYSKGYVKIKFVTTRKGNVKITHTWAATREELL